MLRLVCTGLVWLAVCGSSVSFAQPGERPQGARQFDAAAKKAADARTAKIEAALQQQVKIDFVETPLEDVAAFLGEVSKASIRLDLRSLDDYGISVDMPVTASAADIPLADVLDVLLKQIDLAWTVDRGSIVITTPEALEGMVTTEIYNVSDLVGDSGPAGNVVYDGGGANGELDELIYLIETNVEYESWEDMGGVGVINSCTLRGGRMIVVSHNYRVHRQVRDLLERLDNELPVAKPVVAAAGHPTRIYPLVANENFKDGDVALLVKKGVAAETWDKETTAEVVAGTLIVKNSAAVQSQVKSLLVSLQLLAYDPTQTIGGGGFGYVPPSFFSKGTTSPVVEKGGFFNKPAMLFEANLR